MDSLSRTLRPFNAALPSSQAVPAAIIPNAALAKSGIGHMTRAAKASALAAPAAARHPNPSAIPFSRLSLTLELPANAENRLRKHPQTAPGAAASMCRTISRRNESGLLPKKLRQSILPEF
ncbi:hypothetical protein D3C75_627360 [compost metagenome]